MTLPAPVYIVSATRTPIGAFQGALKGQKAEPQHQGELDGKGHGEAGVEARHGGKE